MLAYKECIYFLHFKNISMSHRKLRMGMIGGGKDAFIGAVHRLALNMDGLIEYAAAL